MNIYDDSKWHINANFPTDLDEFASCIHIGMFLGWVIDNGFEGKILKENFSEDLDRFRKRQETGANIIKNCCDGKLVSEDLNDTANAFAEDYYASDKYLEDYIELSDDENDSIFYEPDTWEKYDAIKDVIDKRFYDWKTAKK